MSEIGESQQCVSEVEQRQIERQIEMLERLAELHISGLLSMQAVEDLKQRVLNGEFTSYVSR
jgi:hypothetical protein